VWAGFRVAAMKSKNRNRNERRNKEISFVLKGM
jgi:hypothetical protein